MDNLITGLIAVTIFLAFVLGLAASIGTIPFTIIGVSVSVMRVTYLDQAAKQGLKQEKE